MRRLLTALALALPLAAQAKTNLAEAPIDRLNLPVWHRHWDASLEDARTHPDAKIVWLGDSITFYWQRHGGHGYDDILPIWNQYYAPYGALDFGFIGDTTSSLIWRLDNGQVAGLHPQLAIILIGANNFGKVHWDAAMTIPGIEAVVENTHHRLPGAHILLLGVLPSIRSPWVDEQTKTTNAALAQHYAGSATVTFMDVGHLLKTDGHTDASLFVDPHLTPPDPPLHPDAEGMRRIAETLAPVVRDYVR